MNIGDTPEEAAFRAECRSFLSAHAAPKPEHVDWSTSQLARSRSARDERHIAECKRWQRVKFDNGWTGLTWPAEHGGRGLPSVLAGIFAEEEHRYDVPSGRVFAQSVGMVGPAIIAHGTEVQKKRFLEPILRGDELWCQLFSEPGAGSDLAGLRTAAVRDGDELVVNGQKVWTSNAVEADWGMLLVRTNPDVPKHRGLTYLLVEMSTPGIEVRPLRQITGAAEFNEVFLDDVRVPVDNVLGEIDGGWGPALTTLTSERTEIGTARRTTALDVAELARDRGVVDEPAIRQDLMRLHTYDETLRYLGFRLRTAQSRSEAPGPESSILKLVDTGRLEAQADLVMRILGAAGTLAGEDTYLGGFWQDEALLYQWAPRIGGGTAEIQRNIVGENVLGLPPEPRVDKGIPFREIPTGRTGGVDQRGQP